MSFSLDPERNVGFLVHDIARLLRARFDARAQGLGLTRAQWRVLIHLGPREGINQKALAEILEPAGLAGALNAEPTHGWKGTPPLTRRRQRLAGHRLFRIGDASGYVEPFTGEGMGWALAAGLDVAPFAIEALEGWSDELGSRWHAEQSRRMHRAQRFCRWMAGGLRRPRMVHASVRIMERYPSLARPLVAAGSAPVHP